MLMTEPWPKVRRRQRVALVLVSVVVSAVMGGSFAFFASRGSANIDPWWGAVIATVSLTAMLVLGVFAVRRTAPVAAAFDALEKGDRKEVSRAVTGGRAVSDPRLAPAAVLYAEQQMHAALPGPEVMKNGTVLGGFGVLLIVSGALTGRVSAMGIGLAMMGFGTLTYWLRGRTRRSADANRALAGPDPTP